MHRYPCIVHSAGKTCSPLEVRLDWVPCRESHTAHRYRYQGLASNVSGRFNRDVWDRQRYRLHDHTQQSCRHTSQQHDLRFPRQHQGRG